MIFGIGIDLVSVKRVEAAILRYGRRFSQRVFTPGELDYLVLRKRSYESYAARFAVKEAAFKALGRGWDQCGGFTSVEVISADSGRPEIAFHGKALAFAQEAGIKRAHVTITHDGGMAAAVVVLEV